MNMREKIARAIDPAWWKHADALFNDHSAAAEQRSNYIKNSAQGLQSLASADAVLDALMEPTEGMRESGNLPGWDDSVTVGLSEQVFTAMIRAAKEGK